MLLIEFEKGYMFDSLPFGGTFCFSVWYDFWKIDEKNYCIV